MDLEKYKYEFEPDFLVCEFESCGSIGIIRKIIYFQFMAELPDGVKQYNLCFGDWDGSVGRVDVFARTNNNDWKKVLATIAGAVIDFTTFNPKAAILIEGSTAARTRLYRMSINAYLHEIERLFYIYGNTDGDIWELFKVNEGYESFLIIRK